MVLSPKEVREIRKWPKAGEPMRYIAKQMGVGHTQVHRIVTGQARREVK